MNVLEILKKSKLCFGPMSKNIVDSIINFSNKNKIPITLIPSRRQIEWNGGYVNNWTTKEFSNYVKTNSKFIAIQRDHGGPGQGSTDDDGFKSLEADCKYLDSIHIDPWKKYPEFKEGLKWTIDILNFCFKNNPNLYYEICTEEAIRKFTYLEVDELIKEVKNNISSDIFNRIIFCVIQSGTALKDNKNIGNFNNLRLNNMLEITNKYNLLSKEHNGDYMDKKIMIDRFNNNLDSINIAPELGVIESKTILNKLKEQDNYENIESFYNLCYKSGKWKKWVSSEFNPEQNKEKLIEICGHYVFSKKEFVDIKNKIFDIDNIILSKLESYLNSVYENCNVYFKKEFLRDVIRIHPPRDQQKIDERLRLHRAERLLPFPENFFNNFVNSISQYDIRYYPYVHQLKDKIAEIYNLQSSNIFLNNGSSENIRVFYQAFAMKDKNVIITNPCYPMHKIYAKMQQSNLIEINYNKNMTWNPDEMIKNINENTCCICFANPNSPIGDIITKDQIKRILNESKKYNIPTLVDEAYINYTDQESCLDLLKDYDNLIISRTFSKGFGCAGLRIGFLASNYNISQIINKFVPTYEISGLSVKFAMQLLNNKNIIDDYIKIIKNEKKILTDIFYQNNIKCIMNEINTIHIKPNNLKKIVNYMSEQNILFRTRKLPHDNEEWLALVLFPKLSTSKLLQNILKLHKN